MSEDPRPEDAPIDEVQELLRAGKTGLAARALADAFEDCLPDLPLRFGVVLVRVDDRAVSRAAAALRDHGALDLRLGAGLREGVGVHWGDARLGDLSSRDGALMDQFGEHAALYTPRPLEISFRDDGSVQTVAIELVRPERQRCARCNREVDAMNAHVCPAAGAEHDETLVPMHGALSSLMHERRRRSSRRRSD